MLQMGHSRIKASKIVYANQGIRKGHKYEFAHFEGDLQHQEDFQAKLKLTIQHTNVWALGFGR